MAVSSVIFAVYCVRHRRHLHRYLETSNDGKLYRHAAVATDSLKCSEIGRDILQNKNGTAVDAAVATSFCLGLLAMHSTGIGGGGVMLIYKRGSKTMEAIDYRETAPGKSRKDMFVWKPEKSRIGALAVAIPGEVKGLHEAHKKYGKLRWKDLLQPTIKMAENGFTISYPTFFSASIYQYYLKNDPGMRELLFKDGTPISPDQTIVNKKLAETLRRIAKNPNDFYNGSLAEEIVGDIRDAGGIITLDDLANYKVKISNGIVDILGDYTLHTTGAPTGGPILTYILNILKGYWFTKEDLQDNTRAIQLYHRMIEAFKFGYAQKQNEGDPAFVDKKIMKKWLKNMASAKYGSDFRLKITEDRTHDASYYGADTFIPVDHGTTHFCILAENGDAVSLTSSINHWYGSTYRSLKTGILYNNQMDDFNTNDLTTPSGYPSQSYNFIKPNKRPVSSMTPLILTDKNGDVKIVLGASGGSKIISAVVQTLMYMTWLGDDIGTAISRPRLHYLLFANKVMYERDRPLWDSVLRGLTAKGHHFGYGRALTAVQGIVVEKPGKIYAKSDPRKEGRPAGY